MSPTFDIVALSGSLRRGSHNTSHLRAAQMLAPDDMRVHLEMTALPLCNADIERDEGFPREVDSLRERVRLADGLIISTPEYNFSVSGVIKNAIDWLSRPPDSPLNHKPVAIMSSAGRSGGARALDHLRQILLHNRAHTLASLQVQVPRGGDHFENGRLIDDGVARELLTLLEEFKRVMRPDHVGVSPRGSVLVVAPDQPSADGLARVINEHGIRTLTALTRRDAGRLLGQRTVVAAVLDPSWTADVAESVEKEVRRLAPGAAVIFGNASRRTVTEVIRAL